MPEPGEISQSEPDNVFDDQVVRGDEIEGLARIGGELYGLSVLGKVYRSIGGYVGGLVIVVSVNAAVTTGFLAIVRVPYFLPLGLLSGLSSLLPMVGNTLAGLLISLVALAAGGGWLAAGVAGFFVLYQQFENQLLGPLVYRQTIHLNPLVGLLAVLVFTELAGIPGALAAVPLVAVGQVILRELLAFRRERLAGPVAPAPGPRRRRRRARGGRRGGR